MLNNDRETALHISCKQYRADMIKSLLVYAKNINTVSSFNYTPLKYLIESLQPTKVPVAINLIQCGADCNLIHFKNFVRYNQTDTFDEHLTCIEHVFKIYENHFKTKPELKLLIDFLEIIINSGYKLCLNDVNIFKVTPLFNQFTTQRSLFLNYYNAPNLLVNLCRIKIRSLLNKPFLNSIQCLNIPLFMKEFLYFK